jgi:hypothetical protein
VKYIWKAKTRNQELSSQAIVAKPNELSVHQGSLNQSAAGPLRLLSVATLKHRIRKVAQTRTTMPAIGVDRCQPRPATRRKDPTTAATSRIQSATKWESWGSCRQKRSWLTRKNPRWTQPTAIRARPQRSRAATRPKSSTRAAFQTIGSVEAGDLSRIMPSTVGIRSGSVENRGEL